MVVRSCCLEKALLQLADDELTGDGKWEVREIVFAGWLTGLAGVESFCPWDWGEGLEMGWGGGKGIGGNEVDWCAAVRGLAGPGPFLSMSIHHHHLPWQEEEGGARLRRDAYYY